MGGAAALKVSGRLAEVPVMLFICNYCEVKDPYLDTGGEIELCAGICESHGRERLGDERYEGACERAERNVGEGRGGRVD